MSGSTGSVTLNGSEMSTKYVHFSDPGATAIFGACVSRNPNANWVYCDIVSTTVDQGIITVGISYWNSYGGQITGDFRVMLFYTM